MIEFLEQHAVAVLAALGALIALELLIKILLSFSKKQGGASGASGQALAECGANSPAVHLLLDAQTHATVYVSDNARAVTGLEAESLYTDPHLLASIFKREDARELEKQIRAWDQSAPLRLDVAYTPKNAPESGKKPPESAGGRGRFCAVRTQNQKYILATFEDRTDVFQKEQALQKQLEQAQMVDESKTIFLSKMSHEIRTPMNGMLGMISLAKLSAAGGNNAEAADYLDRAESLSKFLLSIINDILDMTRIESGKLELESAPFNIGDMLQKIRSMFETTITEKGIKFTVESDDFSKTDVLGDELRLTQIVSNLLSNASKFTPAGGEITVAFRSMEQREGRLSLMMRVKDTGKGMSRAFLHRLFRPFEQEDAGIARRYGGSGLGMSISDSLVRLMGGQILVDSEENKGTEFTVFVDLQLTEKLQEKAQQNTAPQIELAGRRLLMAEDNAVNTMVAVRLLEHRGLVVETAVNGLDCVNKFKEREPGYYDAILMDIHMPEMDGWQATKTIRALERPDAAKIPIFALSADAFVEDKRHSVAVGMNGHIAKPIDYAELEQALKESLA